MGGRGGRDGPGRARPSGGIDQLRARVGRVGGTSPGQWNGPQWAWFRLLKEGGQGRGSLYFISCVSSLWTTGQRVVFENRSRGLREERGSWTGCLSGGPSERLQLILSGEARGGSLGRVAACGEREPQPLAIGWAFIRHSRHRRYRATGMGLARRASSGAGTGHQARLGLRASELDARAREQKKARPPQPS